MSSQHSGDLEYADYGDDDSWGLHINGSFDCSHINNTDDTDSSCSSLLIQMHLPSHQQQKRQELPRGMPKRITLIEEREDINKDTNVFERLQLAEKLIHAYKDALQSKEDLIDSLHENLENTKGVAEDLLQEQGNLLEAIQTLENYQEDTGYLKVVMVCCLMYYFLFNHHNEYILIFAMSLYILQDFILACI